jgi:hypothetical protein
LFALSEVLLQAAKTRLNARQDASPMGFKKSAQKGKRNMATPCTKKVQELHHEKSFPRRLTFCFARGKFPKKSISGHCVLL